MHLQSHYHFSNIGDDVDERRKWSIKIGLLSVMTRSLCMFVALSGRSSLLPWAWDNSGFGQSEVLYCKWNMSGSHRVSNISTSEMMHHVTMYLTLNCTWQRAHMWGGGELCAQKKAVCKHTGMSSRPLHGERSCKKPSVRVPVVSELPAYYLRCAPSPFSFGQNTPTQGGLKSRLRLPDSRLPWILAPPAAASVASLPPTPTWHGTSCSSYRMGERVKQRTCSSWISLSESIHSRNCPGRRLSTASSVLKMQAALLYELIVWNLKTWVVTINAHPINRLIKDPYVKTIGWSE
jgi:hypothetical protein